MLISEFDYKLPDELVAQRPLDRRDRSRMLVVDRAARIFSDKNFSELTAEVRSNDVLVLNNTKVFPARLIGHLETGARIELFLIHKIEANLWQTLARPARRLQSGKAVIFDDGSRADVVDKDGSGNVVVRFNSKRDVFEVLDKIGLTPLPPYIKRGEGGIDSDRDRYQTVFAKKRGAIAAPTAGLHFTREILSEIKAIGVIIIEITLHVGYGTFEPVRVNDVLQHRVQAEQYEISEKAASELNNVVLQGRRIIAVGTTTVRALEANILQHGKFVAGRAVADITIRPGFEFRVVDALLTNFHLPRSSLLILVSAFAGRELIIKAYEHAVASAYRFYSYGDCMLIV